MIENGSLQEGDEDPLAALLDSVAGRLEAFIAGRVRGDVQAVEDLVQETAMHVVAYNDRNDGLPPGEEAVRLLFTIAKRRIINWYERSGKAVLCPSDSVLLTEAISSAEPLDDTVARRLDLPALRWALIQAFGRLTPPQQRALVLVYVDGMDYRTAAAVMGISVDGVKKHLRSAKKRARQLDELIAFRASASTEGGAP